MEQALFCEHRLPLSKYKYSFPSCSLIGHRVQPRPSPKLELSFDNIFPTAIHSFPNMKSLWDWIISLYCPTPPYLTPPSLFFCLLHVFHQCIYAALPAYIVSPVTFMELDLFSLKRIIQLFLNSRYIILIRQPGLLLHTN